MKVNIGPYINWIGPYQLAQILSLFGFRESTCNKVGDWLDKTWISTFLSWVHSKRSRKIDVKIDKYDTWDMEFTLSHIILPMLVQLKETKHGTPYVYNSDLPEHLKKEPEIDEFENIHGDEHGGWNEDGWEWIMDEMIWSMERISKDDIDDLCTINGQIDPEMYKKYNDRLINGTRLFGVYFCSLWD